MSGSKGVAQCKILHSYIETEEGFIPGYVVVGGVGEPRFIREEESSKGLVVDGCFDSEAMVEHIGDFSLKGSLRHWNHIEHPIDARTCTRSQPLLLL